MLDDQDVMRLLFRDQELRVLALGVHRVGGDDAPGQVQRLQQRREPGDLVGLAVHPDLPQDRITADTQSGQDLRRRVRDPFADRGERPRPGRHRRHGGQ